MKVEFRNGKYRCQVYRNGVRKSFTAKTKKDALWMANAWRFGEEQKSNGRITLLDACDMYIESKCNVLSVRTIDSYRGIKKNYFKALHMRNIQVITSAMLQKEVNQLASRLSPKTISNIYFFYKSVLETYVPNAHYEVVLPKKKAIEYHTPTSAEVDSLIREADGGLKLAIKLSAFCGLRRGEICALQPSDLVGDRLSINKNLVNDGQGGWVVKAPKTFTSNRMVKVPSFMVEDVAKNLPIVEDPNSLTMRFCRLRDKLHLGCRFHDLRHYFASVLHARGVPDAYIMKFGGWSNDYTLKNVYRNAICDEQERLESEVDSFFSNRFGD